MLKDVTLLVDNQSFQCYNYIVIENHSPTEVIHMKIWTEEEIKNLIATNDTVLYNALKKLYAFQTYDEKCEGCTKENNGVGFNGVDGPIMSSFCEFLIRNGFLSTKQKAIARKKLVKYNKQLTRIANAGRVA